LTAVTAHDGGPHEAAYFWLTGLLSAFLDNTPTYLVFFELAGADPKALMGHLAGTLASISMGAVYMGALTYIGNAPNLIMRDRAGTRHQDAELLRLHAVGGTRSHSAVCSAHASSDFAVVEPAMKGHLDRSNHFSEIARRPLRARKADIRPPVDPPAAIGRQLDLSAPGARRPLSGETLSYFFARREATGRLL
jgi:hypothetical protein